MFKRSSKRASVFVATASAVIAALGLVAACDGSSSSNDASSSAAPCGDTPAFTGETAGPLTSVSRIAFGDPDVLFVADWKASTVHAFTLPAASKGEPRSFNLKDLDVALAKRIPGELSFEDMAVRPGSNEAYLAVSVGADKVPAIVMAKADGTVELVDLSALRATSAALDAPPDEDLMFWRSIPGRTFTVTDMKWYDGKLYLSGLSNQAFSSTLRVLDYPFGGKSAITSVEMYHTVHNEIETRAPIRAMRFVTLGGKPHLVAAYLCTPLVTIPVDEIKNNAHIQAKTIAEVGDGGIPVDILQYSAPDFFTGEKKDFLLVASLYRGSSIIPMTSLEEVNAQPGLSSPVPLHALAGPEILAMPMGNVYRIADQDEKFFLTLRRDLKTGHSELASINKSFGSRLSDYEVSEFLFSDYKFPPEAIPGRNQVLIDEGYPDLIIKQ